MQMYLLLTDTCNLYCSFCIRGKRKSNLYLDVESLKIILSQNNFFDYYLLITGGEPSLHRNLPDIIGLCQSYFKGVSINTNGVESGWINKCRNFNFHVQISLDGTKEYHNMLRGNGKSDVYSAVIATIRKLNQFAIPYNISTTVGNENYENVKSLCEVMNEMSGMKYWKVSPQLPFGCMYNTDSVFGVKRWNALVDFLLDHARVLLSIKKLFDFDVLERYLKDNPLRRNFPKNNCGSVKYKIYVYPDFTVYPCTCLTDFPIGNLLNSNLRDILKSEEATRFSDYRILPDSTCNDCKYVDICNGGCIGMSYHFFGKLGKGDYRCPLMKR